MEIRRYRTGDWDELFRLNKELFPEDSSEEEAAGLRSSLARPDVAVFVVDRGNGKLAGYVEAGERSIVDGCVTSPVGYIEAWYVDADVRRTGYGRRLLEAAEQWARERGHSETGSDALLDNEVSHRAHRASGYVETGRVINYRKVLGPPPSIINVRQAVPFFHVKDIDRSAAFYVDGLGARIRMRWDVEGKLQWCWLEIGTAALMLQKFRSDGKHGDMPAEKLGVGVSINFICSDAIAYYKELKGRNIEAKVPFVGNSMWVTEVIDPDGYELFFESLTDEAEEKVYKEDSLV